MENNKVAAYIRVSTPKQAQEGHSPDTQDESIRTYVKANQSTFTDQNIATYTEIRSATKSNTKDITSDFDILQGLSGRPKLRELLDDIALGKYKHLIVSKRDRLARNMGQYLALKQYFIKNGVTLHFSNTGENFKLDNEKYNRLLEVILASFAELESRTISTRVRSGCLTCIDKNSRPGARIPYAFKALKLGNNNTLVPIAVEMENVHRIYELYVNMGYGYRMIAEILNKEQDTHIWAKSKVESILKNEIYTGKTSWGKRSRQNYKSTDQTLKVLKLCSNPYHLPNDIWDEASQIRNIKSQVKDAHHFHTPYLLKDKLYYYDPGIQKFKKMETRNYGDGILVYRVSKGDIKSDKKKEYYTLNKNLVDGALVEQIRGLFTSNFKAQIWNLLRNKCAETKKVYVESLYKINAHIIDLKEYEISLKKLPKNDFDYKIRNRIEEQLVITNNEILEHVEKKLDTEFKISKLDTWEDDFDYSMNRLIDSFSDLSTVAARMFIYLAICSVHLTETNGMLNMKIQFNFSKSQ